MGFLDSINDAVGLSKRDMFIELAGELKLTYFPPREDVPAYVTGTYSGRGVTIDQLNERGFFDIWHPHSRIVVGLGKSRRETHIVTKKSGFYSRKLGEVNVDNKAFSAKYRILSSNPTIAEKLITPEVASWIVKLELPFEINGSSITFHQESKFKDKTRVKHAIDALVYIANLHDRISIVY
ncbi:MAG: hypothetical protein KKD39_05445 [Candidatus Altiarchaeota archaeon]|nr:hypothetical protein [Candidatus Altiarchaeota archaeon]